MQHTSIEWVKNPDETQGYTWNPITGCLNHIDGLCKGSGFPCYAYKLAHGRLKHRYLANENVAGNEIMTYPRHIECMADLFYPRFWKERLGLPIEHPSPLRPSKRKGIFVCDMGELFGDWIPYEWQEQIFTTIKLCPYHHFYLLTKQPQNLIKWSPFPDSCWVGVTATGYEQFPKALWSIEGIQAKIKYISFEPLLTHIAMVPILSLKSINWVIIGAQTKPYKPPKLEWVAEIVQAADRAGVKVFLKNNLEPLLRELPEYCIKWAGWGEATHRELRQEMPSETLVSI